MSSYKLYIHIHLNVRAVFLRIPTSKASYLEVAVQDTALQGVGVGLVQVLPAVQVRHAAAHVARQPEQRLAPPQVQHLRLKVAMLGRESEKKEK